MKEQYAIAYGGGYGGTALTRNKKCFRQSSRHFEKPSYLDVLSRITGDAEVCRVKYDPSVVSDKALLDVFWSIHDPTSLNRQGADRGEQYRSVIFYHTQEQEQICRQSKEKLSRSLKYDKAIVTQIQTASTYWLAEGDHQQYFEKKGRHSKVLT